LWIDKQTPVRPYRVYISTPIVKNEEFFTKRGIHEVYRREQTPAKMLVLRPLYRWVYRMPPPKIWNHTVSANIPEKWVVENHEKLRDWANRHPLYPRITVEKV